MHATVSIARLLKFASSSFIPPSTFSFYKPQHGRTQNSDAALSGMGDMGLDSSRHNGPPPPCQMGRPYGATNKFPRFFEVPSISRTGSPRVVGLGYKHGKFVEPMKCSWANAEELHCELDCGHCIKPVNREFRIAIDQLQRLSPPQLNDLTFITWEYSGFRYDVDTVWHRRLWFNQTNLGGKSQLTTASCNSTW